jgi:fructose-bisphosphate aldolase class II
MVHYSALGLCNTKRMLADALAGRYAVPAYSFCNLEQLQAAMTGCLDSRSPVILQITGEAREYTHPVFVRYLAAGAAALVRQADRPIPVALQLDHGDSYELCVSCIQSGFSAVMIDGSALPYDDNVALTKRVVEYAHGKDVTVEGELGVLGAGGAPARIAERESGAWAGFTNPEDVRDFVHKTGIVLHGASCVPPEYIETINRYGGQLEGAAGVPDDQLRKAVRSAVCKVNIGSDGRLAFTAVMRRMLAENPAESDLQELMSQARDELSRLIARKNREVFCSADRA